MFVPRRGLQVSNTFHCRREHLFMRTICSTNTIYSKYLEVEVRNPHFFFNPVQVFRPVCPSRAVISRILPRPMCPCRTAFSLPLPRPVCPRRSLPVRLRLSQPMCLRRSLPVRLRLSQPMCLRRSLPRPVYQFQVSRIYFVK